MTSAIEIYVFSGTGNSMHVAKELQRRIPQTRLVPIVSLLDRETIQTNAETVGMVFPVHGMTAPIAVRMFLKKASFASAGYIFTIATRGGSKCMALEYVAKRLKRKGKRLDAGFVLTMPSNDPKLESFTEVTEDEISELEEAVQDRLDTIQQIVSHKTSHRDEGHDGVGFTYGALGNFLLERVILLGVAYAEHGGVRNYFESTDDCIGCGTCERVCLSNRIRMVDKRPVWQQDIQCYMCYSCLNYCPTAAVQIRDKWYMKSFTREKGRYTHPFATANEIAEQKRQEESEGGKTR